VEKPLNITDVCLYYCVSYPSCNAQAPNNSHMRPAPYFATLSHKRRDFRKDVIKHKMCVLICSTTFVQNSFHSKNTWAMYYYNCTQVLCQVPVILVRRIKLEFSRRIFEKYSHIKFHNIPSSGSRFAPCRQTDKQTKETDMTKLIVAFRNVANLLKITIPKN